MESSPKSSPRTIVQFLKAAAEFLARHQIPSPRLDAEVLLAFLLNLDRVQLYTQFDRPLSGDEIDQYRSLLQRRMRREPVAYLTGKKDFFGYEIRVNSSVLIPRPETERMVEFVLAWYEALDKSWRHTRIADIGTGSGCLPVAILQEIGTPEKFWLVDISTDALDTARKNLELYRLPVDGSIQMIEGDLFADIPEHSLDLILSNPPYIGIQEKSVLQPEVLHFEPVQALFAGEKGTDVLVRLLADGKKFLNDQGLMILEIGPNMSSFLQGEAQRHQWNFYRIVKDDSGKDRFLIAGAREWKEEDDEWIEKRVETLATTA